VGCGKSKSACPTSETTGGGETLQGELLASVCEWEEDLPVEAVPGARIFAVSGCTACHTYRGVGALNLGARDLTTVGLRHTRRFFERFVRNPSAFGNDVMPKYAFTPRQLRELAIFLSASKGAQ
jgi:mono/diheme cytochrome c family protein